jgi:hypothetical protein
LSVSSELSFFLVSFFPFVFKIPGLLNDIFSCVLPGLYDPGYSQGLGAARAPVGLNAPSRHSPGPEIGGTQIRGGPSRRLAVVLRTARALLKALFDFC